MEHDEYEKRVLAVFSKRWERICQTTDADKWWSEIEKVGELNQTQYTGTAIEIDKKTKNPVIDDDGNFVRFSFKGSTILEIGLPDIGLGTNDDGDWVWKIDIARAVPSNPFAQEVILLYQIVNDPPPIPEPIPDHPRGKLDTTAFNAWVDRHPMLQQSEVADLLGVSSKTIGRYLKYSHIEYPHS